MTIEERANKYYYDAELEEGWCQEKCAEFGYIQGAIDQQKIDIEKACKVLNELFYQANHNDTKIFINRFKQAMED